jgi:hypothetical protein
MDSRGFPTSLPEFQRVFPNDAACADYLEKLRWPEGFTCPKCGVVKEPYRFANRPGVLRCRACMADTSLTAGTVMQNTHTSLSTWFWGAYLVTTQTPGQSALQFQRQLDINRYETAFQLLHKLRASMVRPERDSIGWEYPVEVDEVFIGGKTRGKGTGVTHKICVIGAVEVRTRKDGEDRSANGKDNHEGGKPLKRRIYAGRIRLQVLPKRTAENAIAWVKENVTTAGGRWSVGRTPMSGVGPLVALLMICPMVDPRHR